eukprot:TRINITY_DN26138_c0_g2_i1.p1 TRINITY_DN26138_c0_g2~~TRINITY_DN26138_c0_g2_i1.p1  ORF type:complete len:129 (+),score=7.96 TRINITY_DN26138_c0_g2_i1:81-467(+)
MLGRSARRASNVERQLQAECRNSCRWPQEKGVLRNRIRAVAGMPPAPVPGMPPLLPSAGMPLPRLARVLPANAFAVPPVPGAFPAAAPPPMPRAPIIPRMPPPINNFTMPANPRPPAPGPHAKKRRRK